MNAGISLLIFILFIFIGSVFLINGFFGCVGTYCDNKCALITFILINVGQLI